MRQTTVPTVIDSFYLVALGAYRALYICNWIERYATDRVKPEVVAVIFGVIQTLLYVDFAWVYYSRQRVKLRSGGIVDADDLNKSWMLRRVLRRGRDSEENSEEARPALGDDAEYEQNVSAGREGSRGRAGGWGRRGISVSADDDVLAAERGEGSPIAPDARMKDPDELARILHDEDDSDTEASGAPKATPIGGEEWRDRS